MNAKGTSDIVQNTPKVETVGVNAQTRSMQYAEAGTNTNLANNRFAQTQPMLFSEAGTNTNLPSNRFAQTQPIHTQSVNITSQNQISTPMNICKCEDDVEMDETGIEYRSDFARQLQKSEVIPNAKPVTNTERPSQTESSTIYHIPQQSISHTKPTGIEYRQTHGIENKDTDVINYQTQKPLHLP